MLTLVVLLTVTAILEHSFAPSGVDVNRDRIVEVKSFVVSGKDSVMIGGLGYQLISSKLGSLKKAEKVSVVSQTMPVAAYQDDRVEKLNLVYTDAAFWEIYYYQLREGRYFQSDEVEQGRFVTVINLVIARKLFGEQPALGKNVNVRGTQYAVIGVVDDGQKGSGNPQIWVPHSTSPSSEDKNKLYGVYSAVFMAKKSDDMNALKKEIVDVGRSVQIGDPKRWTKTLLLANTQLDAFARGFSRDAYSEDSGAEQVLAWVMVLMFLFMLLPALNLVNLNVGRMMERGSEIGVRKTFGATTMDLVKQFLVENIVLSLVGCAIALLMTQGLLMWINQTGFLPSLNLSINFQIFAYGMLITLVFGIVSGVVPAWRMARLDPVFALKGNV
ncbi:MAG: ABC transporter permease [Burkholderiales bacterium]|nr:ABC transporter permease [Burkholderiales bacterium]